MIFGCYFSFLRLSSVISLPSRKKSNLLTFWQGLSVSAGETVHEFANHARGLSLFACRTSILAVHSLSDLTLGHNFGAGRFCSWVHSVIPARRTGSRQREKSALNPCRKQRELLKKFSYIIVRAIARDARDFI